MHRLAEDGDSEPMVNTGPSEPISDEVLAPIR
jgi:hypothetical protein